MGRSDFFTAVGGILALDVFKENTGGEGENGAALLEKVDGPGHILAVKGTPYGVGSGESFGYGSIGETYAALTANQTVDGNDFANTHTGSYLNAVLCADFNEGITGLELLVNHEELFVGKDGEGNLIIFCPGMADVHYAGQLKLKNLMTFKLAMVDGFDTESDLGFLILDYSVAAAVFILADIYIVALVFFFKGLNKFGSEFADNALSSGALDDTLVGVTAFKMLPKLLKVGEHMLCPVAEILAIGGENKALGHTVKELAGELGFQIGDCHAQTLLRYKKALSGFGKAAGLAKNGIILELLKIH